MKMTKIANWVGFVFCTTKSILDISVLLRGWGSIFHLSEGL